MSKDQGSFDIKLKDAEMGKVVTRFPPEPSGFLHIGHAKAVLLNDYFARHYQGELILRFDDTNALKEKVEYETAIMEDVAMLGVKPDRITWTSDYFEYLIEQAFVLIDKGLAYADDTPQEVMRAERGQGLASKRRDQAIAENRRIFAGMVAGTDEAQVWCLRAKMSIDDANKALRDPVLYRCQRGVPHHRTGSKYVVYPTYDFACPLVDSLEGVTHALRTNEYRDRNAQYVWICDAAGVRVPHVWDYSRLNFVYTLLSKRKLTALVARNAVDGWDDPRFPTVRGLIRRGLTVSALRQYILMQGPSKNTLLLEWDKLWALNKKEIDPIAPRYTALPSPVVPLTLAIPSARQVDQGLQVSLTDSLAALNLEKDSQLGFLTVPKHPKDSRLGTKQVRLSRQILLTEADAKTLVVNEEITLMKWGNIIITDIDPTSGAIQARLNLEGDVKRTLKKFTWLSADLKDENVLENGGKNSAEGQELFKNVKLHLHSYDYLITKKKLEEEDVLDDWLTPQSEFIAEAIGEPSLCELKKGDILQLERIGYFICDVPYPVLKLIAIPDGKATSTASKHQQA
jgi:glutamyl-tRNA synthetase